MNKTIAAIIAMALFAGALMPAMSYQIANADKECVAKSNGECVFNIERMDDIKADKVTIKFPNLGGGGGGTVDQEARDRITVLETENTQLKEVNLAQDTTIQSLNQSLQEQASDDAQQAEDIATLQALVQNLTDNVVVGINLTNGTTGGDGGNETDDGGVIPPTNDTGEIPTNDTGGGSGNETGGGGNETGEGTGNETNTGNTTEPTNDTTPFFIVPFAKQSQALN